MKHRRVAVPALLLLSVSALAAAQSATVTPQVAKSGVRASFDHLKGLAGRWKGKANTDGPTPDSYPVQVSLRVTSGGDALMQEMTPEGRADDPARGDDDPLTMFYLDGDRLMLTHYCDIGKNRPRMTAKVSPDGKSVEFDFLDLTGETTRGHMHRALFTFIDADHHTEDWTYVMPNGKGSRAHLEMARAK
ncbi:MAG TPA: hypothetical protein VHE78_16565 [Gemmatimonadaceae bacterium]|nr:hypothetical protein [Gemmatimonadaceae bacterium]